MTDSNNNINVLSIFLNNTRDSVNYTIDATSVESLYFIEDIFSFCMIGKIKFIDYGDIMRTGNFWGYQTETLTLVYGDPEDEDVTKTFYIYKINKQIPLNGELSKNNIYEITFVSQLYYRWHYKQYSLSFNNKKISDILKHIMKYMVGGTFVNFEASNETIPLFYTGLKSPAENFRYLMERATGVDTKKPGYLCFENLDGYNLITLPKLMNDTVPLMKPKDGDNVKYWFFTNNTWVKNKVMSFEREGVDNGSMQRLAGGYRMGYDIMRKKNILQKYTYKDCRKKFKDNFLGKAEFPLLDPDFSTGTDKYIKTGESNEIFIDNIYYNSWLKQYSNQQLFSLYVKGHQDRKAGGVIRIEFPADVEHKYNNNFNGKFFVKSVVHYFYKDKNPYYNQKLILIKNAYDGRNLKYEE